MDEQMYNEWMNVRVNERQYEWIRARINQWMSENSKVQLSSGCNTRNAPEMEVRLQYFQTGS